MMVHYLETKKQYPDCILFYRLGDFYEMFFEDALTVSKELEITLTGKECGLEERAPMCGIPYHALENYLYRLVQKGYKVAIAEQMAVSYTHLPQRGRFKEEGGKDAEASAGGHSPCNGCEAVCGCEKKEQ